MQEYKKARAAWLALRGNTVPEAAPAGFRVVFWRGCVGGRKDLAIPIKGARLESRVSAAPEPVLSESLLHNRGAQISTSVIHNVVYEK